MDLGSSSAIDVAGGTETAFDLVYYEFVNPPNHISLDWVIIEIGTTNSGPWIQVFYWGDDVLDGNTNIGQAGFGGPGNEPDNEQIHFSFLYNGPGVAIDVDAVSPPPPVGTYQWVRISTPLGGDNDAAEVDSLESLP